MEQQKGNTDENVIILAEGGAFEYGGNVV